MLWLSDEYTFMKMALDFGARKLRVVTPYVKSYNFVIGKAWHGWTIAQVYQCEYPTLYNNGQDLPLLIEQGTVQINGINATSVKQVVHWYDKVSIYTHRHEPVILFVPVEDMIVFDDGDLIVLNKPASIPVHACNAYYKNTIVSLLQEELGMEAKPIHRLDRVVSGLLLLARRKETVRKWARASAFPSFRVQKSYLSKVRGKFFEPNHWIQVDAPIAEAGKSMAVSAEGKACTSRFACLHYDTQSDMSIVQCEPITGRTHQLRVHLQHLGFPIPNDPLYGPCGEHGTNGEFPETAYLEALRAHEALVPSFTEDNAVAIAAQTHCAFCTTPRKFPQQIDGIWLHALRYRVFQGHQLVLDHSVPWPSWVGKSTYDLLD